MPVYGLRMGMTESSAALMLFLARLAARIMQLPIGWAADHFRAPNFFHVRGDGSSGRCCVAPGDPSPSSAVDDAFSMGGLFTQAFIRLR